MIDLDTERLVPIAKAATHIPGRPHISAIYRWMQRTEDPLETVLVGGRRFTSVEAIHRFIKQSSAPEPAARSISARRQREIAAAEKRLDQAGVR